MKKVEAYLFTHVQSGAVESSCDPDFKEDEREMWHRAPLVKMAMAEQPAPVQPVKPSLWEQYRASQPAPTVQEPNLAKAYREELDKLSQRNYELRMENAELKAIPPAAPVQEPLSELQKDAINLLFALHDAWPYVHERCTIAAKKKSIQALISKHGEFAGMHPVPQYPMQEIVNRFLCYKLPKDFQPDGGISFKRESDYEHPEHGRHRFEPTGTNLLTAEQAKAMFEHVLGIKQTK